MGSNLLGSAEKLVDIALTVTDMHASPRIIQKSRRLPEVLQPPNAFLLFNRYPGRVDFALERAAPLNLLRVQNLITASSLSDLRPQGH